MRRSNKIMTTAEKRIIRYARTIGRYKELCQQNPNATHNQICTKIAREEGKTTQAIDRAIRITGNYEKRTN